MATECIYCCERRVAKLDYPIAPSEADLFTRAIQRSSGIHKGEWQSGGTSEYEVAAYAPWVTERRAIQAVAKMKRWLKRNHFVEIDRNLWGQIVRPDSDEIGLRVRFHLQPRRDPHVNLWMFGGWAKSQTKIPRGPKELMPRMERKRERRRIEQIEEEIARQASIALGEGGEWTKDHDLVGEKASPSEGETSMDAEGYVTVEEVFLQNGQVAALRVRDPESGELWSAPASVFGFGSENIQEDVYVESDLAMWLRQALSRWNAHRDYPGPLWDGVEKLCFETALVAGPEVAVEVAGWYRYPSRDSEDMDGKDWRYVIPDASGLRSAVAVNCHSLLHDGVWTLTTTTFSTDDVRLSVIPGVAWARSDDPWELALLMAAKTARFLSTDGYDFEDAVEDFRERFVAARFVRGMGLEAREFVRRVYREVFDEEALGARKFTVAVNDWGLKPDKIASFRHPDESSHGWGIMTVSPRAMDDLDYLSQVLLHELAHEAIGDRKSAGDPHGKDFQNLADALGIEDEHQD